MPSLPARPFAVVVSLLVLASAPALAVVGPSARAASRSDRPPVLLPAAHPVATTVSELPLAVVSRAAGAGSHELVAASRAAGRTAPFQTIGVTWAMPAGSAEPQLLISVRTHGVSGWSGWQELSDDAGDDDIATGPGVRGGTDPLWVGASDGVQARIVLRSGRLPQGLKVTLVNPGSSRYDAVAAGASPGSSASAATTSLAGGVAEPLILSRADWGADESKVRNAPTYMPTIKAAVLHHTAGPNNYSPAQVPAIIRGDYAYHLSRGWSDIGYNALVDRFGRIWEGRAGGLNRSVMGAHAGGFNTDTFGVSMIGNYDVARPTAASITAVTRVMAWKLDLNHRDPFGTTRLTSAGGGTSRYAAGTTVTFPVIMGHRDTGRTACPGRYLYRYLPSIRTRVAGLIAAALTNPAGPPDTVPWGTPVAITARSLAAQTWQLDVTASCGGGGTVAQVTGSAQAGQQISASWNGRLASGLPARPGRYALTLTARSIDGGVPARPVAGSVLVLPPAPPAVVSGVASSGPGGYQPVTPIRLLDTEAAGQTGLGPAGRVDVPVLGRAGIPSSGVTSVVLNLTVGCVSDDTTLAVWPAGSPPSSRPVASLTPGRTGSVLVTARIGANGAVSIGNAQGVTELTADVVGYYRAGGWPVLPIAATRFYDSRSDPAGPLTGGIARRIALPAVLSGVPSSQIAAVMVDVTALAPAGTGSIAAYQPGAAGDLPSVSYDRGGSVDNLAIVPVTDGAILLRATGPGVNALLDLRAVLIATPAVSGAGVAAFTATKPTLVFDSSADGGPVAAGSPRKVVVTGAGTGVPAGASAVLIDLTGIAPSDASTWAQAYPWGQSQPLGAAVRVPAGGPRSNLVLVPVGSGGAIAVANGKGAARLKVDVQGYLG